MRKAFLIILAGLFSISVIAQGNSGGKGKSKKSNTVQSDNPGNNGTKGNSGAVDSKNKDKDKERENEKAKEDKARNDEHDRKVWDGVNGSADCGNLSKNQPAKVRQNFQRDYPGAINVRWTKCRGDWTATFGNGIFLSTAVYHANGDRRDTRTPVNQDNIPRRVLEEIFKKRPNDTRIDDAVRIEVPNAVKEIFRIKNILEGKAQFEYYDADGVKVDYNY